MAEPVSFMFVSLPVTKGPILSCGLGSPQGDSPLAPSPGAGTGRHVCGFRSPSRGCGPGGRRVCGPQEDGVHGKGVLWEITSQGGVLADSRLVRPW